MNPFEWLAPIPGEAPAPPPLPTEVPRFGKPIGPDHPEPKWDAPTPNPTPLGGNLTPQASSKHPLAGLIGDTAKRHGLDPRSLGAMMMIESGGNPNLVNKYGYSGLFQFQPRDFAKRGGQGNVLDPAANADVAGAKFADMSKRFQAQRGRAPTSAELYLMHQQGEGGAAQHWANPDRPAWQNMLATAEGRQKGADWARRAIWDNVPNDVKQRFGSVDNITSADFTKIWSDKVGRFEQRFMSEGMSPTSTSAASGQPRSRGMIDSIRGWFNGLNQTPEGPTPVTAESLMASLDRIGVPKDDPMRGTYEFLAQSLAGGRKAQPEMSPMMKGFGVFADTLGAGLGRRGGNTAAQPMFMEHLKAQNASREKAEQRGYDAPLRLLEAVLPYRTKEIERQRREKLLREALGEPGAAAPQPIMPGGQGGIQIQGGAPVVPVQRAELPPPGGGPAPLPTVPGVSVAPPRPFSGTPGGVSPSPAATPAGGPVPAPGGRPAAQQSAPPGPAGPASKYRVTTEDLDRLFPMPTEREIRALTVAGFDKEADNLRQIMELRLKQRDQYLKMHETLRQDDPDLTRQKELEKLRGKHEAELEHARTIATQGGKSMLAGTDRLRAIPGWAGPSFEKTIGPFDNFAGPGGYLPVGPAIGAMLTAGNKVGSGEVRDTVKADIRAMMMKAKEMVRGPGEGVWTDADQRNLDEISGDLIGSRDTAEYQRKTNDVAERIFAIYLEPKGIRREDIGLGPARDRLTGEPPGAPQQPQAQAGPQMTPEKAAEAKRRYEAGDPEMKRAIEKQLRDMGFDPTKILGQTQPSSSGIMGAAGLALDVANPANFAGRAVAGGVRSMFGR